MMTEFTFYQKRREGRKKIKNEFEKKWKIHVRELADAEGVSEEAIYMRVYNYGTPFQRRAEPTMLERAYGKTMGEIAHETGQHPVTVMTNHREKGDAYWQPKKGPTKLRGLKHNDGDWKTQSRYCRAPWLMEQHPDYSAWRNCTLFQD
jgi:hypothetical protein